MNATYFRNPETKVVHKTGCSRRPTYWSGIPWPEMAHPRQTDRACSYCLPDGLPEVSQHVGWWLGWEVSLEHEGCPGCIQQANDAITMARCTGSVGSTSEVVGSDRILKHRAKVERVAS